jgi:type II restriction/modification system DNA methylase subunit YeeA
MQLHSLELSKRFAELFLYQGSALRTHRITAQQFAEKWTRSTLKERSAAQEHFIDICRLLGEATPAEVDPHGDWYCFERGAKKTGGGDGWADVWKRGYFAWEYKGKHKDLSVAFAQLQRYAIALENPPLLVVSDMARIEIHTNFTNTVHAVHSIPVAEIGSAQNLRLLREVFSEPDRLKPGTTTTAITEEAAKRFAVLAQVLRDRGGEPQKVAHFLNRILFCLFAQDAKLLPGKVVVQLLEIGLERPDEANEMLRSLFSTMKKGGVFGTHVIEWFNGNLFDSNDAVPLEIDDIRELLSVASLEWSAIEPSIIGTLFERGLDPGKRAQVGAHYTDPRSIMRIVEPTVIAPLALRWEHAKTEIRRILGKEDAERGSATSKNRIQAQQIFNHYLRSLAEVRVLDPACGSGNFLYLALQSLKDLEHRASLEAEQMGLEPPLAGMHVGVECVHGIELNSYAAELARVTVWLGEIQWMLRHGIRPSKNPILRPLETIECRDAVTNEDGSEPTWPKVDVIIGNPPFLGDKKMLAQLGDLYTRRLRSLYANRVPGGGDLCCYWFEKARAAIVSGNASACGLVATNSIRGGKNRVVLDRIAESGTITCAWSDEEWVNEGASVRVSLVCFGRKDASPGRFLDGLQVQQIFSNLTGHSSSKSSDVTKAAPIPENAEVCFEGIKKYGAFDIPGETAREWLKAAGNPHGHPNSDVLRPWLNAMDIMRRPSDTWVIDFGSMSMEEAARYERPFAHVAKYVRPERAKDRNTRTRDFWWLFERPRADLRRRLSGLRRYMVTPVVAKHRVFVWLSAASLPSNLLDAIVRDDDVSFGILHSRFHELWSLRLCTWLGVGNDPRYTPTTTFESFPFPECARPSRPTTGRETDQRAQLISAAAKSLDTLRENWLNPSEMVNAISEPSRQYPDRIVARPGSEADLRKRTLTNLYNLRPPWLENAHLELDRVVARAYDWNDYSPSMPDDEIISRLLKLNLERAPDLFSSGSGLKNVSTLSARDGPEVPNAELKTHGASVAALQRRLAVVCTLVNRLADEPHFGRTKMAKLFYLADITQGLELDTNYYRQAAGPLDAVALYDGEIGLESLAIKSRYLTVEKSLKKITYRRGPDLDKAMEKARMALGKKRTAINRLVDLFRPLDTDQCEIVATLYACWNDRIIDRMDVSDNSIVDEFLSAWHDRKRRFPSARLLKALAWMRKNRLVPTGRGDHTKATTQKARSHRY